MPFKSKCLTRIKHTFYVDDILVMMADGEPFLVPQKTFQRTVLNFNNMTNVVPLCITKVPLMIKVLYGTIEANSEL